MVRGAGAFLALALLCATEIAAAQQSVPVVEPTAESKARAEERAKALFESGQEHYERGEYQAAVGAFREAQQLSPRPELLYNLAQAERLSGDCRSALAHYREFESAGGDMPADLPEKIAEMERCSPADAVRSENGAPAVLAPAPAAPQEKPKPAPESSPKVADDAATFRVLGWTSLGGAALSAALGTLFALESNSARNELDDVNREGGQWSAHYESLEDTMIRDRNIAIGLFIGAGVLAGTGGWLLLSPPTGSNGQGLAARAGWRF